MKSIVQTLNEFFSKRYFSNFPQLSLKGQLFDWIEILTECFKLAVLYNGVGYFWSDENGQFGIGKTTIFQDKMIFFLNSAILSDFNIFRIFYVIFRRIPSSSTAHFFFFFFFFLISGTLATGIAAAVEELIFWRLGRAHKSFAFHYSCSKKLFYTVHLQANTSLKFKTIQRNTFFLNSKKSLKFWAVELV